CQKIPLHASLNGYLTWVHCALRKANGMPPYPYNLRDFSYSEEEKSAGNFRLVFLLPASTPFGHNDVWTSRIPGPFYAVHLQWESKKTWFNPLPGGQSGNDNALLSRFIQPGDSMQLTRPADGALIQLAIGW